MAWKIGGLITQHNEMCQEVVHHVVQAIIPSYIRGKPLIFYNQGVELSIFVSQQIQKKSIDIIKHTPTVELASHILGNTDTQYQEVT